MPFATASDGIRLYYEELGEGEPLLLINGQGGDHKGWDAVSILDHLNISRARAYGISMGGRICQ